MSVAIHDSFNLLEFCFWKLIKEYKRIRMGEEISKECIDAIFYIPFLLIYMRMAKQQLLNTQKLPKSCRENKLQRLHSDHQSIWVLQAESRLLWYCLTPLAEICFQLFPSHGVLKEEGELRQEQ